MHLNPHIVFDIPLGSMLGLGPPRGRGIRGAPSKNAGAGIPGPGPKPAKFPLNGCRQWLGWSKLNKTGIFRP